MSNNTDNLPVTKEEDEAFKQIRSTASASLATLSAFVPKAELTAMSENYGLIDDVVTKVDTLAAAIDKELPSYDSSLRDWFSRAIEAHMTGAPISAFPKAVLDVGIRASRFTLDGLYEHCKTGNYEFDSYIINTIGGFFTDMSKAEVPPILESVMKLVQYTAFMDYIRVNGFDDVGFARHVLQRGGNGDMGDMTSFLHAKIAEQKG